MNLETVLDLYKECQGRQSCEDCPVKDDCRKFKQIIENIANPWELERLGFEDVRREFCDD